jgi:hypothetical protein
MKSNVSSPTHSVIDPEFDDLLHPAQAFEHRDVVHDPDLTINEKRAILASWASDACAVRCRRYAVHQVASKSLRARSSTRYAR